MKLEIGQKIWVVENDSRRNPNKSIEVSITKIGSKYFETSHSWFGKFEIKTLRHNAGAYSPRYRVYLSKEDFDLEVEHEEKLQKIRTYFGIYGQVKIEIDILRKVYDIIF